MRRKWYVVMLLLCVAVAGIAQQNNKVFDIDLWQQGLPDSNGMDSPPFDESIGNFKPSIRVFLPDSRVATGKAVLICPGGAYVHLAYHHEGYDWAPYFNKMGIAAIVLKYRMPKRGHKEVPYSDAEEAMRLIKSHASQWNINPDDVGIMGSSAGGHLASTVAVRSTGNLRPDFQILFYPVITMDKKYTHMGSHDNLLGPGASKELEEKYSNEKQVTGNTPPAFIVYSDDDDVVAPDNGVNYYLALRKHGIPASLHIYPSGGHGWGILESFLYKNQMLNDLEVWLKTCKPGKK